MFSYKSELIKIKYPFTRRFLYVIYINIKYSHGVLSILYILLLWSVIDLRNKLSKNAFAREVEAINYIPIYIYLKIIYIKRSKEIDEDPSISYKFALALCSKCAFCKKGERYDISFTRLS